MSTATRGETMPMHLHVRGTVLLCGLLVAGAAGNAGAQVCGDTLGPGGTVTLTQDLVGCTGTGSASLSIIGPVKVDMAGHQIQCDALDPGAGIHVSGEGAQISNGSVRGCGTYGVHLAGTGKHSLSSIAVKAIDGDGVVLFLSSDRNKITGVSVTNVSGTGAGFRVMSNKNTLRSLVATNIANEGFVLGGTGNKVTSILATQADKEGILVSGELNKIEDCESVSAGNDGIEINGGGNRLRDCTASRSTGTGFVVAGDDNTVDRSDAANNGQRGFEILGAGNTLAASTATSSTGDGVYVDADDAKVAEVRAVNNGGNGIQVAAGTGNEITRSVALESGGTNDVRDTTACAAALWSDNTFRTSNDPCID